MIRRISLKFYLQKRKYVNISVTSFLVVHVHDKYILQGIGLILEGDMIPQSKTKINLLHNLHWSFN